MNRRRYAAEELYKICPVCGYDELREAPFDTFGYPSNEVCACCGFEYGFDDGVKGFTYDEYREKWLNEGFQWFSSSRTRVPWNAEILMVQLTNIHQVTHYRPYFVLSEHLKKLK